jgi:Ni,Fe-hydrogenase III small subunit
MLRLLAKALLQGPATIAGPAPGEAALAELAAKLEGAARARLGRSLAIREVDAGSCNGCELEINALNNAVYDLERFGIRFVASPRHADILLVTGPVTTNMREALLRTYQATPDPKWVVAVGDCAVDGGLFAGSYAVMGGVESTLPVDLHIRGCPPSPRMLLEGLLALLEQSAGARPGPRVGKAMGGSAGEGVGGA